MSEYAARQALERMNLREVAIAVSYTGMGSDLQQLAKTTFDSDEQAKKLAARNQELCESFGFEGNKQSKPFAFANGIAIIPVAGTLINRFNWSYSFVTGYQFIRKQLAQAMADDEVKGIVFDVNSYGGEAAGCFELADDIYAARDKKPILAVVDSNCYSAAYAIASACTKIAVTPSGGVGSIGVVAMHVDMSKLLDAIGYKVTFIHFGEHKVDGNPYEALSASVKADIQKGVDKSGEKFVALVARNRSMDAKKVKDTEARTYRADDALSLGLIDTIATPSQAVQVFYDELTGSESQPGKENAMTDKTNQPDAAEAAAKASAEAAAKTATENAAAEARKTEKARVAGILGCEEAKGRTSLANHLALETDMSLEAAQKLLKAAAVEGAEGNQFKEAMDKGGTPGVGASTGGENNEMSAADRILGAQTAATGIKHDAKDRPAF